MAERLVGARPASAPVPEPCETHQIFYNWRTVNHSSDQDSPAKVAIACSHAAQTVLFPASDYITGDQFKIVRCDACGLALTMPRPTDWSAYYPATYYGSQDSKRFPGPVEFLQDSLYASRVRQIEKIRGGRKGRVLDIGCGRGLLLQQFQKRGWEVHGTEMDDKSAAFAREVLKLPIQTGDLASLNFPENHFDAIVMWHVLEHIPAVAELLREVKRFLKPGGIFLVAVPNFGSPEAQLSRDNWFHLDVPRHLNHFTRDTLLNELSSAGLVAREVSYFAPEYDSFSFVQSTLNNLGLRRNALYNFLRSRNAKVLNKEQTPILQTVLSLILAVPLGLLSLVATTIAGLTGRGAAITIFANKQ